MITFGFKEPNTVSDWEFIVGNKNWVPKHSAYELAQKWHGCRQLPERVATVLATSAIPVLERLNPVHLYVEHPTFLDVARAPSRTDIMVHCRTPADETVIIGVEGKALESFGDRIFAWVRDGKTLPTPTRQRRLDYLGSMLGVKFSSDETLRYQLVHRTASIVREAALHGAVAAVVLIHSFSEQPDDNWLDFQAFLKHLQVSLTQKNTLSTPCPLGPNHDVLTYFVWITDEPAP